VRPDFKGLPKGSGSVAKGMDLWEAKCASCHGVFGESNQVFSPLVGGTTKDDVKTGHVARLLDPAYPGRTTLMKVATLSTLWDYIHRAMPWNAPKSLTPDEVYALTAYLLNLGDVLPENFTLSDANIAVVQQMLPNRNGMSIEHGLWPGAGMGHAKPDVQAVACMNDCRTEVKVASSVPEHARNSHGNLAEQNRSVGLLQRRHGAAANAFAHALQHAHATGSRRSTPNEGSSYGWAARIALTALPASEDSTTTSIRCSPAAMAAAETQRRPARRASPSRVWGSVPSGRRWSRSRRPRPPSTRSIR